MGDGCQYCKGWERSHLQQQERIAELETELQRFKTVATVQAAILRGLTEWIETLPSQAWAIEKSTGEAAEV